MAAEPGPDDEVLPPPEIKTIIDKTAQYVARNGPEFEAMILNNNQNNAKFNFLKPSDPFHAHYRKTIAALSAQAAAPDAGPAPQQAEASAGANGTVAAKASTVRPATAGPKVEPLPLPEHVYHVPRPAGIDPLEADIIMLSAQFIARNGRRFLSQLTEREGRNPQFDFLRPQHHLFGYFTALVDAYSRCLVPPAEVLERVRADGAAGSMAAVHERMQRHAEWMRREERKRREKEAAADAERMQQLMVDWHDFVIVETITFDDDDESALPAAAPLEGAAGAQPDAERGAGEEESVPVVAPEPAMRIRKDYVPEVRPSAVPKLQTAIDPISGQEMPLDQLGEHMRISLLDPRWKEQKQLAEERQKDSNVARGTEIGANIARFAQRRTDIFGEEEVAIGEVAERERRERERAAKDRVMWDGHSESIMHAATAAFSKATQGPGAGGEGSDANAGKAPSGPVIGPAFDRAGGPPSGLPTAPPPPPSFAQPGAAPPGGMPPPPPVLGAGWPAAPPGGGPPPQPGLMPPPPPTNTGAGPQPGLPPPPPMAGAPPHAEQPDAKRQRTGDEAGGAAARTARALVPADAFLSAEGNDRAISLTVQVPVDGSKPEWGLEGQTLSVQAHVRDSVQELKEKLKGLLGGMPPNKQQLTGPGLPMFKDRDTLATYNLADGESLTLKVKVRGGR